MIKAYKDFWKRYFDFGGKSSVGEFWWAILCNMIVAFVVGFVARLLKFDIISWIFTLLVFIPELAILCRRLRDGGNSLLNILWLFLPIIGWIILLIKLVK